MEAEKTVSKSKRNLIIFAAIIATVGLFFSITHINSSGENNTTNAIERIEGDYDPDYITIEFDGTKFKLADTYGEIIREIAKQRPIYDWGSFINNTYATIDDVDTYLNSAVESGTKNTTLKKQGSEYPDISITVATQEDDINPTAIIANTKANFSIYDISKKGIEFYLDGHKIITAKTTDKKIKKIFEEINIIPNSYDSLTSLSFNYKNRLINIIFDKKNHTLIMINISQ